MATKKAKIAMLPTEDLYEGVILLRHIWKGHRLECRSLWQYKDTEVIGGVTQYTTLNGSFRDQTECFEPQHLYLTVDEKPRSGDWFVLEGKEVFKAYNSTNSGIWFRRDGKSGYEASIKDCRKIVATTDTSLRFGHDDTVPYPKRKTLPSPSQAFIKKYCDLGGIDEVLIEYTLKGHPSIPSKHWDIIPKVDSHNTITIKPFKDSWSKEEVTKVLLEYSKEQYGTAKNSKYVLDWVEENL
ncbi:hypothetical protein Phi4:1_gp139 [Cellulophaga phage phi4:1]|uniref:Uncharacterized protein n=3 Tax=Lightbulbvirus Cba41 TaxID=1918524 RepID=A0A0S2MWT3_9CAUD|nr:hypothetical protein Phi4:1_gp139 [Cellulophaga phage phi4:1]AGO49552.1 hypothetical protein Phi4:1_gp139 [Cellulophaga phage phi4:1]ALO80148.1 hypothetical protein Phi4113_139 [Cellulophaga phage phi4:1_13]ALO80345.1 hypothetical protein Phi4118_139 [Cellulophaga phage phi4:1_18]